MRALACASVHVEAAEGGDEMQGSRTGPWQPDRRKGGVGLAAAAAAAAAADASFASKPHTIPSACASIHAEAAEGGEEV